MPFWLCQSIVTLVYGDTLNTACGVDYPYWGFGSWLLRVLSSCNRSRKAVPVDKGLAREGFLGIQILSTIRVAIS